MAVLRLSLFGVVRLSYPSSTPCAFPAPVARGEGVSVFNIPQFSEGDFGVGCFFDGNPAPMRLTYCLRPLGSSAGRVGDGAMMGLLKMMGLEPTTSSLTSFCNNLFATSPGRPKNTQVALILHLLVALRTPTRQASTASTYLSFGPEGRVNAFFLSSFSYRYLWYRP